MPICKAGKVTITYNGVDLTNHVTAAWVDEARAALDAVPEYTIDVDPQWFKRSPLEWASEFTFTFVRVRPAAPVPACLWRRNLDGGNWRKRGHVAHRRERV